VNYRRGTIFLKQLSYCSKAATSSELAALFTTEVVTPKNRATSPSQYPSFLTANWQNSFLASMTSLLLLLTANHLLLSLPPLQPFSQASLNQPYSSEVLRNSFSFSSVSKNNHATKSPLPRILSSETVPIPPGATKEPLTIVPCSSQTLP